MGGEGAELRRVPELEGLDGAVLDVGAHVVRGAEARQLYLAPVLGAGQVLGGRLDADRGGGNDPLQAGVLLKQSLGLLKGLLGVVVTVGRLDQLDVLVLGLLQLVLHEVDPGVLVGGRLRRREDRDLALAADLLRQQLDLGTAQVLGTGLGDEHLTTAGLRVGVVRHDADAVLHRLLQCRAQGARVLGGDGDGVDLLLGEGVDVGDLSGCVGAAAGADLLVRGAELLQGLLAAAVRRGEVGIVDLFGQEGDRKTLLDGLVRVRLAGGGGRACRLVRGVLGGAGTGGGTEGENGGDGESGGQPGAFGGGAVHDGFLSLPRAAGAGGRMSGR